MKVVAHKTPPDGSLLAGYREARAYTDAFSVDLGHGVTFAEYVEAFYTTPLFRLERLILAALVARPSRGAEARALAVGEATRFAAWTVEAREPRQIVMCDFMRKTRSWLMVTPLADGGTRLWFGSAIVPERISGDGRVWLGAGFQQLVWFHRLYSRALLTAAARRSAASDQRRGTLGGTV